MAQSRRLPGGWDGEARAGEPGALHLGRSLDEPGPREGSRLPNPAAQPGLPAPLWQPEKPEAWVGAMPGGWGRDCQARPLQQLPARQGCQPRWCPSADAAVGRPLVPALLSASLPEWRCGQGPAWEARSCRRGLPGCLGLGGGQPLLDGIWKQ